MDMLLDTVLHLMNASGMKRLGQIEASSLAFPNK